MRKLHCSMFQTARPIGFVVAEIFLAVFIAIISPISSYANTTQAPATRQTIVLNGSDMILDDVVKIAGNNADIREHWGRSTTIS